MRVLKFSAKWCRPCVSIRDQVVDLCARLPADLTEYDVDDPEGKAAMQEHGVTKLPTIIVLDDDCVQLRHEGGNFSEIERKLVAIAPKRKNQIGAPFAEDAVVL